MRHLFKSVSLSAFVVLSLIFILPLNHLSGQTTSSGNHQKQFIAISVGFYNVENLFDTIKSPGKNDEEFTPEGPNRWDTPKYLEKLDRLSEVIAKMGIEMNPDGPAVMGLCEVENAEVVWDLVRHQRIRDRNYQVIHYRSRDRRVDNAFIYQPKYFQVTHSKSVPIVLPDEPNFRTRDHLVVSGLMLGEPMHFIVAHWPSRRGGEKRSRHLRVAAADNARSIIDSLKAIDPQAKIVFMGDLNDDPNNVSVRKHLSAHGNINRMKAGDLFNPFEDLFRKGIGSLAWRDSWNLFDQIIITQSFLGEDRSSFKFHRSEVFNRPFLRQPSGRFQGYPFRSYAGGAYIGGYSDHFPTLIFLLREVNKQ